MTSREEILAWNRAVWAFRAALRDRYQHTILLQWELVTSKVVIRCGMASPLWVAHGGPR